MVILLINMYEYMLGLNSDSHWLSWAKLGVPRLNLLLPLLSFKNVIAALKVMIGCMLLLNVNNSS